MLSYSATGEAEKSRDEGDSVLLAKLFPVFPIGLVSDESQSENGPGRNEVRSGLLQRCRHALHHPQGTNRAQAQMTRVFRDTVPPRPVHCVTRWNNVTRRASEAGSTLRSRAYPQCVAGSDKSEPAVGAYGEVGDGIGETDPRRIEFICAGSGISARTSGGSCSILFCCSAFSCAASGLWP